MNTNQSTKNKELNLSVTAKVQKSNGDFAPNSSGHSKDRGNKHSTLNKLPACSGGVCTVNWKPIHNIA